MLKIKLTTLLLLSVFWGISCQKSLSQSPDISGVEGQVFIGPVCPGPERTDVPCPDKPFQATITVLDIKGNKIDEFQTNADGKFSVMLPPGTYTFIPNPPSPKSRYPRASSINVEVKSGEYSRIIITYDTGMR